MLPVEAVLAERERFAAAIRVLASRLRILNCRIYPCRDPFPLRAVHAANVDSDAKTAPNHDIAYGPLPPDWRSFLVIEGDESQGPVDLATIDYETVVATTAVRLYDWSRTDGKAEIESGRAFSGFEDMGARIRCAVPPAARELTGRVAHSGALWIRPRRRKPQGPERVRIARIMSMFNRYWACFHGDIDWIWSLTDRALAAKGVVQEYGYLRAYPGSAIAWPGLAVRFGVLGIKARREIGLEAAEVVRVGTEHIEIPA